MLACITNKTYFENWYVSRKSCWYFVNITLFLQKFACFMKVKRFYFFDAKVSASFAYKEAIMVNVN